MKLLVLYEELAGYTIACLKYMVLKKNAEVHVIRKKINTEAPFQFDTSFGAKFYQREDYSDIEIVDLAIEINPDIIFCGGWMFPPYLKISKKFFGKIPTVVAFDNWWTGNFKQQLARIISPFYFKRLFSHCFVPGLHQKEYAVKLGYKPKQVYLGFYCCDYHFFCAEEEKERQNKKSNFPRKFLFVGRYIAEKGIEHLWTSFLEAKKNTNSNWELWCLGTGPIEPMQADGIKHFGFVQPNEMGRFLADTGVFVLPSVFEPWGVVVHEMACAGFPIIATNAVGAASEFVVHGENGFLLDAGNPLALQHSMEKIMTMDDQALLTMGEKSKSMAERITPEKWCNTFFEIVEKFKS
jgi:glycosyltransferase involved in cell wall biosynthesis